MGRLGGASLGRASFQRGGMYWDISYVCMYIYIHTYIHTHFFQLKKKILQYEKSFLVHGSEVAYGKNNRKSHLWNVFFKLLHWD